MKKINPIKLSKNKNMVVFVLILVFWWSFLNRVDFGKSDIFHDRDQDGLTDEEEYMYGTDVNNPDSDGDGYRDGIEVESGYDPLKPSPGDKIVFKTEVVGQEFNNLEKEEDNLTNQFFETLASEKSNELNVLGDYYNNPEKYEEGDELETLNNLSFTSEELQKIINQTTEDEDSVEKMELIPESEIKVLDEVFGNERKKKEEEKDQIEKYLTQIFYVLSVNKPFAIEEQLLLSQIGVGYINNLSSSIQTGHVEELKELKNKAQETYNKFIEIETPYKMKDIHLRIISLIKYLTESINEDKLVSDQDPMALALYVGKLQAAITEGELIKDEIDEIVDEYEIEMFDSEGLENIFKKDKKC